MAELVDALDSGSSGHYACGGSSPPFRMPFKWAAIALIGLAIASLGCKSESEQAVESAMDQTLNLHDQVYRILETNVDNPEAALNQLRKLEESSRAERKKLRADGIAARDELSEESKAAFIKHAKEKHDEYSGKFAAILLRYEKPHRDTLKALVSTLTH